MLVAAARSFTVFILGYEMLEHDWSDARVALQIRLNMLVIPC